MQQETKGYLLPAIVVIGFSIVFYQLYQIQKSINDVATIAENARMSAGDAYRAAVNAWNEAGNATQAANEANDTAEEARDYASNCY